MRPHVPLSLLLVALAAAAGFPAGVKAQDPYLDAQVDLEFSHDALLEGRVVEVTGDLVVRAPSTLRVEGATVLVGGRVFIERGASLFLSPAAGLPARLAPLNATNGFWMQVDGHLESGGEPRSVIEGLNGDGLNSVVHIPGGVKVNGTAVLRDAVLRNGTAGIIVEKGASLVMEDSRFEDLYLMGLAVLGEARLDRVESVGNIIGVTGRGPACRLEVRNSTLENMGANFQMVACPTVIEDSRLLGSSNNVMSGELTLTVRRTDITGYFNQGLRSDGRAVIHLEDVLVEGGPEASNGIELAAGNTMTLERVTVRRHSGDGILATASALALSDVKLHQNGGNGLRIVSGEVPGLSGTDFGSALEGTSNGDLAVSHIQAFSAVLLDEAGRPVPGLTVAVHGRPGPLTVQGGPNATSVPIQFEAYGLDADGRPADLGPFTYRATHASLPNTVEGEILAGQGTLVLHAEEATASTRTPWIAWTAASLGLLLLVYSFVAKPFAKSRDRGQGKG